MPSEVHGSESDRSYTKDKLHKKYSFTNYAVPTGALDKKTGTQIMELLHSVVKENGIMLLLVTHDPDIADTCDTIFEMDGGRITCAKNDT